MSRSRRATAIAISGLAVASTVLAVVQLSRANDPPRRAHATPVAEASPSGAMHDSSELSQPDFQIDARMLQGLLAQAGVTPETLREAKAEARREWMEAIRTEPDPFKRRVAIFYLWNSHQVDDEAVDAILAVLAAEPEDEGLIAQALYAMKDSPRADVAAVTMAYLRSAPSAAVRMSAVKALHFRPGADVTRAIEEHLGRETDPPVVRRSVVAMASRAMTDPMARGVLETVKRYHADPAARQLAEEMIAENERVLEAIAKQ